LSYYVRTGRWLRVWHLLQHFVETDT